ncbi:MAG: alpha/beta fold hydrolase [bacterium]|nr:alpha/beta fold hydrolase [bacterium]
MDNIQESPHRVLALHGFTLGGAMFAELAEMLSADVIAPDLPGHGGRDTTNTGWDDAVDEVVELARDSRPNVVLGYSMGGRLAVAAALREPASFPQLVLVSTSLGVEDVTQRIERQVADMEHARIIEEQGTAEPFVREFGQAPLLQAPNATIDLTAIRLANSAEGICGALRGMSQGCQPYMGYRIADLEMPIVWMAGNRDPKYAAIAQQAATTCRHGRAQVVEGAHNVIAENPEAVVRAIVATP